MTSSRTAERGHIGKIAFPVARNVIKSFQGL